jgi:hypothetical protein
MTAKQADGAVNWMRTNCEFSRVSRKFSSDTSVPALTGGNGELSSPYTRSYCCSSPTGTSFALVSFACTSGQCFAERASASDADLRTSPA